MRIFSTLRYSVILLALLNASCGTALPTVKPYKLDVQQGNVVTSKMLLQLRPGMTKSQVRFIMGTPLVQDSFHGNRWDYVYQMREKGKITEQRRVILDFDGESLKTVRGDVIPKGSEDKTDDVASNSGTRVINPTSKPEEKGVMDKLKFWKKDEAALAKEAEAAKLKADAEEAARSAEEQAKEDLARKSATPIEEPESVLAVPLEVAPVAEVAPAAAPLPLPVEPAAVEPPVVEAASPEPVAVSQPEPQAVPEPVNVPVTTVHSYESSSGMKFDSNLNWTEETQSATTPADAAPRAGNKSIPKPKDLPAESKPGLFNRMKEMIGF